MSTKTFNISFPRDLADEIDAVAKNQFATRSDFLRMAALKYLRDEQQWKEITAYGKKLGQAIGDDSETEVAEAVTANRRQSRNWAVQ